MTRKTYTVYFTRTSVGRQGGPLGPRLEELRAEHGNHLPPVSISNDSFQLRDLQRRGRIWSGTFAKLRDDAPHVVAADDRESELELEDGARVLEKCHFLLRGTNNVLVWQMNKAAGGMGQFATYLSRVTDETVTLPHIVYVDQLEQVLAGDVYEIVFAYDRPRRLPGDSPRWNQRVFDVMNQVDAAHAKLMLRAARRSSLSEVAKDVVREMVQTDGSKKLQVRLTDEHDPIDLFMAPVKGSLTVELAGRYAVPHDVFEGLEAAYDEHRGSLPDA